MSSPASGHSSLPDDTPLTPSADATLAALQTALAGQYDVERLLGAGGMGSVYLGRDVTLDRRVAIKVIAADLAAAPTLRERFLREARTVARLRHPNIVAVHSAGEAEGLLYFVMEFVPGESLRDRLARVGRYDDAAAVATLRDLARALGYAHAQGVVHRDVKPENVLLDAETGRAMLTDFGVARAFDAGGQDERVTGMGFVVGSPRYMSPEQAAGERDLDGRSDLYSLGLVGYEMFAGEPAIAGGTAASIIMRQITERPAPLLTRSERVPPAVASVVERALEKQPEARWASANEMADALDLALSDPHARTASLPHAAAGARPAGAPAARRPRARFAVVAGVAAAALGAWLTFGNRGDVPRGVDPRKSYLVAPFDVLSPDPQLAWLRDGAVSMLSLDLAQWRDLTVVDYERGLDLQRALKLEGARRIGREDALRLARRAGVWTVVTGRVTGTPDSTIVVANVYAVETGEKVDSAMRGAPRGADPRALFSALSRDLLDLVGAPATAVGLATTITPSVEAYRDYLGGVRALHAWQLARADSLFDAAARADTTFALAYYKRALTYGWWKAGDTAQMVMLDLAVRHAGRLPARERGLLTAYQAFATAMYGDAPSDSVRLARFADARRQYAAAAARDSTDAEAWYGLADAYYHGTTGNWNDSLSRANWTRSLAYFNRTLALDSSFHLAYSHKVQLYQAAAGQSSTLVLDGDTFRTLNDAATRQAFQGARLTAARRRARELALRDARAWVAEDPEPPAFMAVALAYLPDHWDSAAIALDDAVRRLGPKNAGALPFARAVVLTRVDPARAVVAAREALASADSVSLARSGGADRFGLVLGAMQVAAMGGRLADAERIARLAAGVQRTLPGSSTPTLPIMEWYSAATRLAAGVPPASVRAAIDGGIAALERAPGRAGDNARRGAFPVAYVALLATRDARYADIVRRWRGPADTATWHEIAAFTALLAGDTARAAAAARRFPNPDSALAAIGSGTISAARWVMRAEVLAALGDTRRALATYEVIDPKRLGDGNGFDAGQVLYARSLLARGGLHEQLGQRAEAAAAYERFVALWKDADPSLQPQVRDARAVLARLRDAGTVRPVR